MNTFENNTLMEENKLNALKMFYLKKKVRIINGISMHYGKIGTVTYVTPYGMLNVKRDSHLPGCYENIVVPIDYVEFCNEEEDLSLYPKVMEDAIMNDMIKKALNTSNADLGKDFKPKKIIHSGPKTIVFFKNGEKVVVSCGENETYDDYTAFCAALAKKIFGSTSRAKKIMKSATVEKKEKKD
uniref:Uncharacterized protein n=1 Tax=Siphoviridae sp. ct9lR64 TaxID=2826178 RepID=A0A8S5QY76_9CAUD|nr:MAG TPA: hypothetical protein [Siphoviridae sp. ct9lR64]